MKKILAILFIFAFHLGFSQKNQFEIDTDILHIKIEFDYNSIDSLLNGMTFELANKLDTIFVYNNYNYDIEYGYNSLYLYYPVNTNLSGLGGRKAKLLMILPNQTLHFVISVNRKFSNSFDFCFFYSFIKVSNIRERYKSTYPEEISPVEFDILFEYSETKARINLI